MSEIIRYEPSEKDEEHLTEIRDFLDNEGIPYIEDEDIYGLFHLNEKSVQLRYVDSFYFPMDNEKRFGEIGKGVPHNYFIDISHSNADNGIRTIWCFDFEMEQSDDVVINNVTHEGYRRQWEVIKNTIRTCCGRIHHRIYARDCYVKEVDNKELRPFLNTNCFYGYRSASVNLGLYLK